MQKSELRQNGWRKQIDQDYLRTGTAIGFRAYHEH